MALVDSHVHIYLSTIPPEDVTRMKKDLTVRMVVGPPSNQQTREEKLFRLQKDKKKQSFISVPRAYGLRYLQDNEMQFRRVKTNVPSIKDRIRMTKNLRPHQVEALENGLEACIRYGGATISAHCGFGKSFTGAALAHRLDGVTLVLVHMDKLADQWVDSIYNYFEGAYVLKKPTAEQLLQSKQLNPESASAKVVTHIIMTVQFLVSKPPGQLEQPFVDFLKHVGVILADEAHIIPAKKFRTCIHALGLIPYRIALTATPERKDQLHHWTAATFGEIVFRSDPKDFHDGGLFESIMLPKSVRLLSLQQTNEIKRKYGYPVPTRVVKKCYVTDLEQLVLNPEYNRIMLDKLDEVMQENPTRCTMFISFYKSHLHILRILLRERGYEVYSLFGSERDVSDEKLKPGTVLVTSYSLGSTAMDYKNLNTLFLASPRTDVLQTIGRILRNPKNMLIIDMVNAQNYSHAKQYAERKLQYEYYGFYDKRQGIPSPSSSDDAKKRKKDSIPPLARNKRAKVQVTFIDDPYDRDASSAPQARNKRAS